MHASHSVVPCKFMLHMFCTACGLSHHALARRYSGPPVRAVLERALPAEAAADCLGVKWKVCPGTTHGAESCFLLPPPRYICCTYLGGRNDIILLLLLLFLLFSCLLVSLHRHHSRVSLSVISLTLIVHFAVTDILVLYYWLLMQINTWAENIALGRDSF